ncbi:MAG: M23 family metallopeptidase [Leptospira sp.]|nr:M23 family metallopeptidase [Leptospira sp.]
MPLLLFIFAISVLPLFSSNLLLLSNLDYSNSSLKKLREEVKHNLKISKTQPELRKNFLTSLKFYKYKVGKKDNFFIIMARTGMDLDTLSSVNDLSSPQDLREGMVLKIPNMRGVFDRDNFPEGNESKHKLSLKYNIDQTLLVFDRENQEWFIPGKGLERTEKSFFYGLAFGKPLMEGFLSSGFGIRHDPFTKKKTFHGGLDIAAEKGTEVIAAAEGEVIRCEKTGGYGNLVVLKHPLGYETRYGHLNEFAVRKGDRVKRGEKIGEVGSTGRSTGNHLHFEVRRFSKNQKPVFKEHT